MITTKKARRKIYTSFLKTKWALTGQSISIGRKTVVDRRALLRCEGGGAIEIGSACRIHAGAQILTYGGSIKIGSNSSVNPCCILYGHGDLDIGNNVLIAAQTVIVPSNHVFSSVDRPIKQQGLSKVGIVIEDDVWIGSGVRILDGVVVKTGCVIGAGAVVTRSTEPFGVYLGIPAKRAFNRRQ